MFRGLEGRAQLEGHQVKAGGLKIRVSVGLGASGCRCRMLAGPGIHVVATFAQHPSAVCRVLQSFLRGRREAAGGGTCGVSSLKVLQGVGCYGFGLKGLPSP
jgi:hypothetical protein